MNVVKLTHPVVASLTTLSTLRVKRVLKDNSAHSVAQLQPSDDYYKASGRLIMYCGL
jgi:hypothetical protein